jgi:phosphoglycerol transferase MdoB-like AlkP superfamily enzyme
MKKNNEKRKTDILPKHGGMTRRLLFLPAMFGMILATFVLQKPAFMLYNRSFAHDCSAGDRLAVMMHGLALDATMTGYFMIVPWLTLFVGFFMKRINMRKILLPYFILAATLSAIVFVTDASLYSFWNFKLDATALLYLDSPEEALASTSGMYIASRILVVALLSGLYTWLFAKITPAALPPVQKLWNRLAAIPVMLLAGFALFGIIRGGFRASTANTGRAYFSDNQFLNHSAINPVFNFMYSLNISEDFSGQFNFFPEQKRSELFDGLYPKGGETTVKLLTTTRPNIVIILLESFAANFMETFGGKPEITPNMNRLAEEGILFTNFYSGSFRTDRGIVCALSGHPGLPTASIMKLPAKSRSLPSIAGTLNRAGYVSDFLYGGDIDFTNMKGYFIGSGYGKITADRDFSRKERNEHAWGVNDKVTFDRLFDDISKRTDTLWHTGFLTLSSHEPFIVPYHRLDNRLTNAFAYTDECIGTFVDRLKQTPAWDNLLIVMLADHGYCYPETLTGHDPDFFHTPMLWLGGAVAQPAKVSIAAAQTDLAATLLGQLNLPHDDFLFSRDIFSSAYTYPFVFFAFNNGFGFKDNEGISVYDNHPDRVIFDAPTPAAERVEKGKTILQTLYSDLGKR